MSNTFSGKVSIVGAGAVGAAIAYACMIRGVADEVAIYDVNAAKVRAETLDLNHGTAFVPPIKLDGSDDVAITRGSSVIVVTAGAKQKPGQTRLDLAGANVEICRSMLPQLLEQSPDAILLIVTNPVDVITHAALTLTGLPRERVFGSGTVLDSARFRFLIAKHLKLAVQNVHAYIAGEHGDSEVPLWSSASIGTIPLSRWHVPGHGELTQADRETIFRDVRTAAYQIIEGKGATNYAIGLSTANILEAVLGDENRVLPVSTLLPAEHPIADGVATCLSVPCVVNRAGVGTVLPVPLSDDELSGLRRSARVIGQTLKSVGF